MRSFSSSKSESPSFPDLLQRVSSFLIGAGLTALVTQYYIFEQIREGNKAMLEKQLEFEKRIIKLEK